MYSEMHLLIKFGLIGFDDIRLINIVISYQLDKLSKSFTTN